jgi:hypothetical protein
MKQSSPVDAAWNLINAGDEEVPTEALIPLDL